MYQTNSDSNGSEIQFYLGNLMQKIPDTWQTLITNVNLVTMTNGTSDYSIVKEGALAIRDGKIA